MRKSTVLTWAMALGLGVMCSAVSTNAQTSTPSNVQGTPKSRQKKPAAPSKRAKPANVAKSGSAGKPAAKRANAGPGTEAPVANDATPTAEASDAKTGKETTEAKEAQDGHQRAHRDFAKHAARIVFSKALIAPSAAHKPASLASAFTGTDSVYGLAVLPKTNVQLGLEAYSISIYVDENSYPSESADLSSEGWNTDYFAISVFPSLQDAPDPRSLYQARWLCKGIQWDTESKHKFTIKIHPNRSGQADTSVVVAEGSFVFDGTSAADAVNQRCRDITERAKQHPFR